MGFEFKMNGDWFPETPETFEELQSLACEEPEIWEAICDSAQNDWGHVLQQLRVISATDRAVLLEAAFPTSPNTRWSSAQKILEARNEDLQSVWMLEFVGSERTKSLSESVMGTKSAPEASGIGQQNSAETPSIPNSAKRIQTHIPIEISIEGAEALPKHDTYSAVIKGLFSLCRGNANENSANAYLDGVHIGSIDIRNGILSVKGATTQGEHTIKLVGADVYIPVRWCSVRRPLFSFEKKFCVPECKNYLCRMKIMITHHNGNSVDYGPWDSVEVDCQTFVTTS